MESELEALDTADVWYESEHICTNKIPYQEKYLRPTPSLTCVVKSWTV
jgi:hypothetical protein